MYRLFEIWPTIFFQMAKVLKQSATPIHFTSRFCQDLQLQKFKRYDADKDELLNKKEVGLLARKARQNLGWKMLIQMSSKPLMRIFEAAVSKSMSRTSEPWMIIGVRMCKVNIGQYLPILGLDGACRYVSKSVSFVGWLVATCDLCQHWHSLLYIKCGLQLQDV